MNLPLAGGCLCGATRDQISPSYGGLIIVIVACAGARPALVVARLTWRMKPLPGPRRASGLPLVTKSRASVPKFSVFVSSPCNDFDHQHGDCCVLMC
jgi:hypothetical protein